MIVPSKYAKNNDFNVRYRPYRFDQVVGNENIIRMISRSILNNQFPHASLFTGVSGCGKTTISRIIALSLNCMNRDENANPCGECDSCRSILNFNSLAVQELDGAKTGNVDTVRHVLENLPSSSMGGEPFKVLILDEAHVLSDKAEKALLKFLEDTPSHCHVILCTNEPQKLEMVTKNRCKAIQFPRLTDSQIYKLMEEVCQFEGLEYKKEILNYIVEESNGVPRQALNYLQQVGLEGTWTKEAVSMIINVGVSIDQIEVYDFCKVVLNSTNWKTSLEAFKKIKKIPIETIRISLTGFFIGCLKNARSLTDANKYSKIVDIMSIPIYDPKPEHRFLNNLFKSIRILKDN